MFNRVGAKEMAKKSLKGNWGKVGGIYLLIGAITSILSMFTSFIPYSLGIFIDWIIGAAFTIGYIVIAFKIVDGEYVQIEDAFIGFKNFLKAVGLFFWQLLWLILWSLLFIVPGIIKSYSYRLSFYILADNPDIAVTEALNESKRLMEGNKADLWIADLSFMGWSLVATFFTLGIGYFWLVPYMQVTYANIYKQILANNEGYKAIQQ